MSKRIGNPDSKYTYRLDQLEKDLKAKAIEHRTFKELVRHLVIMDPSKMDLRYKDLIDVAMELKQEFNL